MKVRLNKKVLADMPPQIRFVVLEWKNKWRKSFISITNRTTFSPDEDCTVTMINLFTNKMQSGRVAGDFAGHSGLRPHEPIPLKEGIVAVVTGFFLGHPYLTIYQGIDSNLLDKSQNKPTA